MIISHYDGATRQGRIILRPNRSWTWRANAYFVSTLLGISLSLATAFTVQGYWLVLPFTALEMAVLLGCLYYCVRRTHRQEVLTLSQDRLVYERGVNRPTERFEFHRFFTRFFVHPAPHPWYRKSVALKCRETEMEIGSFLSGAEKDQLVAALRTMISSLEAEPRGA